MSNNKKFHSYMDMEIMGEILNDAVIDGIEKCREEEKDFKMKKIKKVGIAAALVMTVGIGAVLSIPTLADGISNLEIVKQITSFFKDERRLDRAVDEKYGEEIMVSVNEGDTSLNIIYGMKEEKKLILFYQLKDKEGNKIEVGEGMLYLENGKIKLSDGSEKMVICSNFDYKPVEGRGYFIVTPIEYMNDGTQDEFDFREIDEIELSGTLKNYRLRDTEYGKETNNEKIMSFEGLDIRMDSIQEYDKKSSSFNEVFKINETEVELKNIEVGPTESSMNIVSKSTRGLKEKGCITEIKIADKNGKTIKTRKSNISSSSSNELYRTRREVMYFENPYFSKQELYIKEISVQEIDDVYPSNIFIDLNIGDIADLKYKEQIMEHFEVANFMENDQVYEFDLIRKNGKTFSIIDSIYIFKGERTKELLAFTELIADFKGADIVPNKSKEYYKKYLDDYTVLNRCNSVKIKVDKKTLKNAGGNGLIEILMEPESKTFSKKCDIKIYPFD